MECVRCNHDTVVALIAMYLLQAFLDYRQIEQNTSNIKTFTADDSLGFPMHREQRGQIRRALGLPKEQEELTRIQVSENCFDCCGQAFL